MKLKARDMAYTINGISEALYVAHTTNSLFIGGEASSMLDNDLAELYRLLSGFNALFTFSRFRCPIHNQSAFLPQDVTLKVPGPLKCPPLQFHRACTYAGGSLWFASQDPTYIRT